MSGTRGQLRVTAYSLTGINLTPDYLLLDDHNDLFAFVTADFAIVREGYEAEDRRLRALAAKMSTENYSNIERRWRTGTTRRCASETFASSILRRAR